MEFFVCVGFLATIAGMLAAAGGAILLFIDYKRKVTDGLREIAEQFHEGCVDEVTLRYAADYIERLRADVDTWHSRAEAHRTAGELQEQEIERLREEIEDTRLAVRCFVRQVQFEGGIVTQEDFDRWPWIEQWILDKLPDEA